MFSSLDNIILGKQDPFNKKGERNPSNVSLWAYNCGGYALGTYSWYCPSYELRSWAGGRDEWYELDDYAMRIRTKRAVRWMLQDFHDLRVIVDLSEIERDEYAIAFRVSSDGDFHFIRQGTGRLWYHKPGGEKVQTMSEEEVFSDCWGGRYDGELILFAKKKNNA